MGDKGQAAQHRGAQNNAGQYLANHLRLPQFDEDIAQKLGEPKEEQNDEENRGQLRVGHAGCSPGDSDLDQI
jgi:hypothetical protein